MTIRTRSIWPAVRSPLLQTKMRRSPGPVRVSEICEIADGGSRDVGETGVDYPRNCSNIDRSGVFGLDISRFVCNVYPPPATSERWRGSPLLCSCRSTTAYLYLAAAPWSSITLSLRPLSDSFLSPVLHISGSQNKFSPLTVANAFQQHGNRRNRSRNRHGTPYRS